MADAPPADAPPPPAEGEAPPPVDGEAPPAEGDAAREPSAEPVIILKIPYK